MSERDCRMCGKMTDEGWKLCVACEDDLIREMEIKEILAGEQE